MRVRTIFIAAILLGGCEQAQSPMADLHDSKYSAVELVAGASGDCALDKFTGLMWEVKSDEPGLHDWRNTYSWFDPEASNDELDYRGAAGAGECVNSECDTSDFVRTVNESGYCGFHDWRLPSRDELQSISDLRKAESPPTINSEYFPFTQPNEYWSANDYSFQFDAAWVWNFRFGHDRVDWKKTPKFLRLVRGEAEQLIPVKE
jgi:Protein of unknown function (DUF1566)